MPALLIPDDIPEKCEKKCEKKQNDECCPEVCPYQQMKVYNKTNFNADVYLSNMRLFENATDEYVKLPEDWEKPVKDSIEKCAKTCK
jgi:hypothetical protein